MKTVPLTDLNGRSIVRWMACEMALSEYANGDGSILWEHESIPYLQLSTMDVQLDDGAIYRLFAQSDDGSGYYGLFLSVGDAVDVPAAYEEGSIFRRRELNELPCGTVNVTVESAEKPNAITRIIMAVGSHIVTCWAAEVYDGDDGSLRISGDGESMLVQVDGVRPRRKHQRTPKGAAEH